MRTSEPPVAHTKGWLSIVLSVAGDASGIIVALFELVTREAQS